MLINQQLAEEMTREIKGIVPFYFNIMDDTGTILTCTDQKRNGTKHKGTFLMTAQNLDELIVEQDNQYPGCTMGVLFSIRFGGKIIGFVGIRGMPEKIIDYGRIIQKMTELLVYEKFENYRQEANDHANNVLIENMIQGNQENTFFDMKQELTKRGLDYKGNFTIAIIKFQPPSVLSQDLDLERIKQKIMRRQILDDLSKRNILVSNYPDYSIVVSNQSTEDLYRLLQSTENYVVHQYKTGLVGAISRETSSNNLAKAYMEASAMIRFLSEENKRGIYQYRASELSFILKQIVPVHSENLCQEVFQHCSQEERYEFANFIIAYMDCDGSLKLMSDRYFLHKNTIQYKIKKIYKKTGYDMRRLQDLFVLYIAALQE